MIRNIIIIILLLGFVAVVVFLDVPKFQEILDLRNEVEIQKNTFLKEEDLLAKVENLKSRYEKNEEELKKVNYILPTGEDVPNLIVQIEAIALESGVALESINISSVDGSGSTRRPGQEATITEEKDYEILSIRLNISGQYEAFKNFLKTIENNIRLMDIQVFSFSLESSEALETVPIFTFNLTLNTYYLR